MFLMVHIRQALQNVQNICVFLSLVAESAVRQLKLFGYENKQSGVENYNRFRQVTYSEEGSRYVSICIQFMWIPAFISLGINLMRSVYFISLVSRLQQLIQGHLENIKPVEDGGLQKHMQMSVYQQRELKTVLPVIWTHVQVHNSIGNIMINMYSEYELPEVELYL